MIDCSDLRIDIFLRQVLYQLYVENLCMKINSYVGFCVGLDVLKYFYVGF